MRQPTDTTVVVFTENNARVFKNPPSVEYLSQFHNTLINPSFKHVVGIAPHHWKVVDGEIHPMDIGERHNRDKHIARFGVNNNVLIPDITPTLTPIPITPVESTVMALPEEMVLLDKKEPKCKGCAARREALKSPHNQFIIVLASLQLWLIIWEVYKHFR